MTTPTQYAAGAMADFDLTAAQAAILDAAVDGWLFCQFRGRDPIADRVLKMDGGGHQTRRWFYFVPAEGEPRGLVHAIEPKVLERLPGEKTCYMRWQELEQGLASLLVGASRVAMQYAPNNRIPYVSTVDAGTVELVRSSGVEVVSSADLVQTFTATLSDRQIASHREAARQLPGIVRAAYGRVREALDAGERLLEVELQHFILERFETMGLMTADPPIVAVNAHSADPHYAPGEDSAPIRRGDWLLIDLWARLPAVGSVYADITWVAQGRRGRAG